jgi:putative heme iron utilization protein
MTDQSDTIRGYFKAHSDASSTSAASALKVTEGEILAALEGTFSTRMDGVDLLKLAEEMAGWGRLRFVVRNATAVSEMLGTLEGVRLGKGWLTVENDHFHLHVKSDDIRQVYLFHRRGDKAIKASYSVQFLNRSGEAVLKAFLLETSEGSSQVSRLEGLMERQEG